jgi:hypothetical protein
VVAPWGSFRFLEEPVLAFAAVAILGLVLRWTFSHGKSLVSPPPRVGAPEEYGMLRPVAAARDYEQAERVIAVLSARGIRGISVATTSGLRVMVWHEDLERAQAALPRPQTS